MAGKNGDAGAGVAAITEALVEREKTIDNEMELAEQLEAGQQTKAEANTNHEHAHTTATRSTKAERYFAASSNGNTTVPGADAVSNPLSDRSRQQTGGTSIEESEWTLTHSADDSSLPNAVSTLVSNSRHESTPRLIEAVLLINDEVAVATRVDVDEENSNLWTSLNTKKRICFVALSTIILAAILVGIGVGIDLGSNEPQKENLEENTSAKTESSRRRESMIEILAPLSEYGAEVFDPSSPNASSDRINALDWIVDGDPLQSTIPAFENVGEFGVSAEADVLQKLRQRYILALLYFAMNGDFWDEKLEFLSGVDECDWTSVLGKPDGEIFFDNLDIAVKGAICDDNGALVKLILYWNNLSGTLPHELSFLSDDIAEINFAGGSISGIIPPSFTKLTNLETLAVSDNCMTGHLPESLSSAEAMPNLNVLALHNNPDLVGSLNGFCDESSSGLSRREGTISVTADCPIDPTSAASRIDCDCCTCCDRDRFECTDLEYGGSWSMAYLGVSSRDGFIRSFDNQCLSPGQKDWVREECPCVINVRTDPRPFYGECIQNCTEPGAIPSYNFDLFIVDESIDSSESLDSSDDEVPAVRWR